MTKIPFYIKKNQFMSLEVANFLALLFCTFSVFYVIFILKIAHLVTYKIACTMQYYWVSASPTMWFWWPTFVFYTELFTKHLRKHIIKPKVWNYVF